VGCDTIPEQISVSAVNPGSPAAEAGVLPGDIITRIDGRRALVRDTEPLRERLRRDGQRIELTLRREPRHVPSGLSLDARSNGIVAGRFHGFR
jgi:putative serine protease PepD